MTGPRTLVLDIETAPAKVWIWGLYNQNIGLPQIIEPTRMICFAAKWTDAKRTMFFSEWDHGHEGMVNAAYELLTEADMVVTFNGDRFDLPHLNREFAEWGHQRPAPYQSIDLYKATRKQMRFLSHKMAHITERLELTEKLKHEGFELWTKVLAGDPKAQRQMRAYNKRDVTVTEDLYFELLPWIDNHPNLALFVDKDVFGRALCPRCASPLLQRRGFAVTRVSKYQRYQCTACGAWSRDGKRVEGVDVR